MKSWIVVGYYTKNTAYVQHADKFVTSLKVHGIPYYVEGVNDLGNWYKNTNYKPTFLKRMLDKFHDLDVVYVDCDAEFKRYPVLFDELTCDVNVNVAVHEFDLRSWGRRQTGTEVLSGTIFLKNNETVHKLVEDWEQECQENSRVWDQKSLEKVLAGNYYRLPEEYCKIFDVMRRIKDPVIVHYQASRVERKGKRR